jgi:hypothetical protein
MEALAWLEASAPAQALRSARWSYAAVNALHIFGIALLVGAVVPLDLRRLGLWRSLPEPVLARALTPVAAAGLVVAAAAGAALFAVRATEYAANPALLVKLTLVALGVANALLWTLRRGAAPPLAAALSLLVWPAALVAGRFIAFVD